MVTKYDVFEAVYTKGTSVSPPELLRIFQKPASAYAEMYQTLLRLQRDGLLLKSKKGFQVKLSPRSTLLYRLIRFSLANNLPYNYLIDRNMASFLQRALTKKIFSWRDFQLNPRTFTKYIDVLNNSGFLLIFSRKPLLAALFPHSFLQKICGFFNLKLSSAAIHLPKISELILKKELRLFNQLQKKNTHKYLELVKGYQLRFIQHSLNLEGNPITLPETVKLLQHQVVPEALGLEAIEEVRNYQQAMGAMLKDVAEKKPLTIASIFNYHYLALQHKPSLAGEVRTIAVHIKNNPQFKVAPVPDINARLEHLLMKYNQFITKKKPGLAEIFHFAAYFHNEFQHIHPFVDGNSRTTRLLTFHLLRSVSLPVIDIPLGLLEEYLSCTKGAARREDQRLRQALEMIVFYNLRLFNEELRKISYK
ncbi:Fic family protein [Candidatus Woesearchaeota archaeon]|nr:Fic family protein [Candidatus Woesearchaeota archaeon]